MFQLGFRARRRVHAGVDRIGSLLEGLHRVVELPFTTCWCLQCALSMAVDLPAHFYIATDSEYVLREAKRVLGEHRVVHQMIDAAERQPDMQWRQSIIDLELLGKCDVLIGTANSSFTLAAHQAAFKRPHLVRYPLDGCFHSTHSQLLSSHLKLFEHHELRNTCAQSLGAEYKAARQRVKLKYLV